jgi:hypothetical protein
MRNNEENIFRDGELVETIIMPLGVAKGSPLVKKEWAKDELGNYVSKFHGKDARNSVIGNVTSKFDEDSGKTSHRVTGTQAQIFTEKQKTVYMLVEPKKQPGPDGKYRVHVIKAVYSLITGQRIDVIRHQINQILQEPPKNTAMAEALAALKR